MARRRRDEEYEDDDRQDRRERMRRAGGGSNVWLYVGITVGICVVLLVGTYLIVQSSKKGGSDRSSASSRSSSTHARVDAVSRGNVAGSGGSSATGGPASKSPRQVNVTCMGRWEVRTPEKDKGLPDPRQLEAQCPACGKKVAFKAESCSCGQPLQWPEKVKCGWCGGDGVCKVCGAEHLCPWCEKNPPRQMMGIALDQCAMGCTDHKCPACKGGGRCNMCEGEGSVKLREDLFK